MAIDPGQLPASTAADPTLTSSTGVQQNAVLSGTPNLNMQGMAMNLPTQDSQGQPWDPSVGRAPAGIIQQQLSSIFPEGNDASAIARLSAYLGMTPNQATAEYQAYQAQGGKMTPTDWAAQNIGAAEGSLGPVLDAITYTYVQSAGHLPPQGFRQQMRQFVQQAVQDPEVNNAVQQAIKTGQYASLIQWDGKNITGVVPIFQQALQTYQTNNDPLSQQAQGINQRQSLDNSFFSYTGHHLSDEQWNQYESGAQTYSDLLNNSPYRNTGMSYQAYNSTYKTISGEWQRAFGRSPSDSEVYNARQWSEADLKDYIVKQPSQIEGLNIGEYDDMQSQVDKLSQDIYGHTFSPDFTEFVHKAVSGQ